MSPTATRTRKDWEQLAAATRPEGRAFINGQLVAARDGRVFEDVSPINGQVVAEVAGGARIPAPASAYSTASHS
jgi:hypothetical protein